MIVFLDFVHNHHRLGKARTSFASALGLTSVNRSLVLPKHESAGLGRGVTGVEIQGHVLRPHVELE